MADDSTQVTAKQALRERVRIQRRAMSAAAREEARRSVRNHVLDRVHALALPPDAAVAGYEPLPSEPGSLELLSALATAGYRVLLPITQPDRDLNWRTVADPQPLGISAISEARVVLVPAFAVDRAGNRLGRGGGSYDRALARIGPSAVTAALLFTGEVVAQVPTEPWDRPVTAAVTPNGWVDLV